MLGRADRQAEGTELAGQVEPVRRWLTGYFRRRVREDADVEDLVQDVFTRIVTRESPEPIKNLGSYVMKMASSVIADRGRRRLVRHADLHLSFDPDLHAGEEIDPERVLRGKEELNAAVAALLVLPERTRTVFLLRRLEGYSYRDIAAHLGISVSAVEKHLVKAVTHLSKEKEKYLDS